MGISVIIPTLNEEGCLGETIAALRRDGAGEIIVVDGGSMDGTADVASAADRFLQAPRGRAAQMNAGAAHARGHIVLFLHADCQPGEGALVEAESCLGRRGVVAGCFRMRVAARGVLYRCVDACATARVRFTGIVYGDQGLFLRRARFWELGGFPAVRFMEDVLFSMTLRRAGRVVVASRPIHVSARRWQRAGMIRQTLRNWTLTALAAAGVHPDRLERFYPPLR